jgi:hypothetical protein
METETQSPAPEVSLRKQAESFLGAVGTALVVIYALGFLILSLYDAKFGIVELDPLRARIFATGVAFVCLLVLPVAAMRYGFTKLPALDPITHPLEPGLERQRKVMLVCAFIYTARIMATFLCLLVAPLPTPDPPSWLHMAEAAVPFCSFSSPFPL